MKSFKNKQEIFDLFLIFLTTFLTTNNKKECNLFSEISKIFC